MDNEYISQLLKSIRDKGEQPRIADAGTLQGLNISETDQRKKLIKVPSKEDEGIDILVLTETHK